MKNNFVHRPIEFRVWDKERQAFCVTDMLEFGCIFNLKNGVLDLKNGKEYYIFQQLTGLLDKNGKEIFEGDIIKCNFPDFGCDKEKFQLEVVYSSNTASFGVIILMENGDFYSLSELDWRNFEVVGNVFENPELLK